MSYLDQLTATERAEFDAAVTAAYRLPNGATRSHAEALDEFVGRILPDAVQAHRRWAGIVHDEAVRRGLRGIIQERWKGMAGVFRGGIVGGKTKVRPMRRGVVLVDPATGDRSNTQLELIFDTAEDLQRKIADAVRQIDEQRANIAMFRRLLDLLERTEQPTVERALAIVGMDLDEYLSAERSA